MIGVRASFYDPVLIDAAMRLEHDRRFLVAACAIGTLSVPQGSGSAMHSARLMMGAGTTACFGAAQRIYAPRWRRVQNSWLWTRNRRSLHVTGNRLGMFWSCGEIQIQISGRLLAIFSDRARFGVDVGSDPRADNRVTVEARALCAWFNSTLGALGFLMGRGTMLTNPSFSQAELATLRIPDFKQTSPAGLAEAYDRTKRMAVNPWKNSANDEMRDCLDRAASETVGTDIATIRDMRARISREPTVSNEPTIVYRHDSTRPAESKH